MKKNILSVFILAGLVTIILVGYYMFVGNPAKPGNTVNGSQGAAFTKESFPQSLAGSTLAGEVVSGPDAMQNINRLHGASISVVEGFIAQYLGKNEITVWVSVSATTNDALALFDIMDKKMPASQMFTNREELQMDGKQVIKVLGMGQDHYYWVRDKQVYWIAVGGGDSLTVLQEALKL
ncbi:MAG: hypothetical protein M0Z31_10670 [Clostridia bacterium]|nr:hypothetical protein [Clostridia bacterium]